MKLIVTEKPSVAQQFAKTLGVKNRSNGYISNDEWTITWCVGHLVTMSYPEKYDEKYSKWDLNDLPFLPKEYKYEVIKDVKDQYKIVEGLLKKADVIYNCGDSGREGEAIQRFVYEMAGVEGKKKILRVWIDSQTDEEIKRGIREAKPESAYDNLAKSAKMRGIEDYAIGINLSRALSCKFGYEFNKEIESKKYIPIAVGRVMTCVLGMIVKRELEIMMFQPVDYYKIDSLQGGFKAHWKAGETSKYKDLPVLYNESGFKEKDDAARLLSSLQADPRLKVDKLEKKDEQKKAPLLYNLAELQAECSKKYKISPDETLEIAQTLYESKFTTYPRTDARVISTAVAKEINENLKAAACNDETKVFLDEILKNNWQKGIAKTKYCDDSKITDHYAIIPTGIVPDLDSLSDIEKNVYMLILKRFLAIFFPPAIYAKTSAELLHSNGERFYVSKKVLTSEGFLVVSGKQAKEKDDSDDEDGADGELGTINKGDVLDASFSIVTSTTQPPKRYTSGSMILAMENAGNLIEDEELRAQIKGAGIGTSATRAEVIKKLIKNKYIECNSKTQVLKPTFIGTALYEIVDDNVPSLLSPEMTASWEKGLSGIENGTVTPEVYEKKLNSFIIKSVNNIKSKTAEERPEIEKEIAGNCPICGADLYETEKGYFCSKRRKDKKSCQFAFPKTIGGKPIPKEQIDKLLKGQNTDLMDDLQGKNSTYSAYIEVKPNGECALTFPHEETELKCPKCGKKIRRGSYTFDCESCKFSTYHTISGHQITDEEFNNVSKNLFIGPIEGLRSKEGVEYSAYLVNGGNAFFPVKSEIAGRKLSREELLLLLMEGKTGKLSGFKGKKGEFDAGLKLNNKGMVELVFLDDEGKEVKKTKRKSAKKRGFK